MRQFFGELRGFFDRQPPSAGSISRPRGTLEWQQRIVIATRYQPGWHAVELAWRDCSAALTEVQGSLELLHLDLGLLESQRLEGLDSLLLMALSLSRQCLETRLHLEGLVSQPHEN